MLASSLSLIEKFLEGEKDNYTLWYTVFYLLGILTYFTLDNEPKLSIAIAVVLVLLLIKIICNKCMNFLIKFLINLALIFALGILISTLNTARTKPISIKDKLEDVKIRGEVIKIKPTPYGTQLHLKDSIIEGLAFQETPEVIRVSFSKFAADHILIGDQISVKADLSPPASQVVPGGYDFKLIAFFNKIGATGRAKSEPEIIFYADNNFTGKLLNLRKTIYSLLIKNLGSKNGNFAAALFLGEIGGISQTTLKNMRFAGISHILCVSGLHLSLVAAIFFLSARFLLNLSDTIAMRFDVKKLAGYVSLIASFFYLMLTGMQIAATRAFVMTSIAIWSILIARQPYPMRSLSIACIIILTINPEYAIHPSFQLSFIAVISLLVGYEFYAKSKSILGSSKGIFASLKMYLFSNIYSSVVASLATSPIVIYHFYVYSNYSVLANLIAVPVVSFISMPIGILALILSLVNLQKFPFFILGKSIDLIRNTADFITSLPKAVIYCGNMENFIILIFLISFFWLSIWKSKIRYLGIGGIMLSLLLFILFPRPTIIINTEQAFVAQNTGDKVVIYGNKLSPFTKNFVANWFGYEKAEIRKINLQKNAICLIEENNNLCMMKANLEDNEITIKDEHHDLSVLTSIDTKSSPYKINYHRYSRFLFR